MLSIKCNSSSGETPSRSGDLRLKLKFSLCDRKVQGRMTRSLCRGRIIIPETVNAGRVHQPSCKEQAVPFNYYFFVSSSQRRASFINSWEFLRKEDLIFGDEVYYFSSAVFNHWRQSEQQQQLSIQPIFPLLAWVLCTICLYWVIHWLTQRQQNVAWASLVSSE